MSATPALSTPSAGAPFEQTTIERRALGERDVSIEIEFCGICHSDIHQVRDEWGGSIFPMVPGHEIVGRRHRASATASSASQPATASASAAWSTRAATCEYCEAGEEQFCTKGAVLTYNGRDHDGEPTYGGYSRQIVVDERFVVQVPDAIELARRRAAAVRRDHDVLAAAPLGRRRRQQGRRRRHGRARPRRRADRRGARRRGDRAEPDARASARTGCASAPSDYHATSDASHVQAAARPLRPDPQHGLGEPPTRRVPRAAARRRHARHRRRARRARPLQRVLADRRAAQPRRIVDRRHARRHRRCSTSAPSTASGRRSS